MTGLELDPSEPGYRHIIFRPRPGGTITWAEARLKTPQSEAEIRWEKKGEDLALELTVPEGSLSTLEAPEGYQVTENKFKPGQRSLLLNSKQPASAADLRVRA